MCVFHPCSECGIYDQHLRAAPLLLPLFESRVRHLYGNEVIRDGPFLVRSTNVIVLPAPALLWYPISSHMSGGLFHALWAYLAIFLFCSLSSGRGIPLVDYTSLTRTRLSLNPQYDSEPNCIMMVKLVSFHRSVTKVEICSQKELMTKLS